MKNILNTRFLLPLILLVVACQNGESGEPAYTLTIDKTSLNFTSSSTSSQSIIVTTEDKKWKVRHVDPTNESWLVATANLQTGKAVFQPKSINSSTQPREAKVLVTTADESIKHEVTIIQLGTAPTILVDIKSTVEIPESGGSIKLTVTTNVDYKIELSSAWITTIAKSKAMESFEHSFVVAANTSSSARTGTLAFVSKSDPNIKATITVIQSGGGSPIVINKDIKIIPTSGEALGGEFQSANENIDKSFDGNLATIYHSRYSGRTIMPVTLDYNMPSNATRVDYIIYHTRNGNGNFGKVELQANTRTDNTFVKIADYDFAQAGGSHLISLPSGKEVNNPKTFRFVISSGSGGFASCAEMEFYKKGTADPDQEALIKRIFKSTACAELLPEATDEDIKKLPSPLQVIALELKTGAYPSEFRCQSYKAYSSPEQWAQVNLTRPFSNLGNPTGIEVIEGEKFYAFVGPTHGNNISLLCVTNMLNAGDTYILKEGVNEFTAKKSGPLYVMYHVSELGSTSAKHIEVHLPKKDGGYIQGYFNIEKHKTAAELQRLLQVADVAGSSDKTFVMQGHRVQLNFLKKDLMTHTASELIEALGIWDEMINGHWDLMGINDQYPTQRNNRQLGASTVDGYYMYATDYFTHYASSTIPARTVKSSMFANRDRMWGPGHEFGHQTDRALSWHGYSEASNNLFSNLTTWQFSQKYNTGFKTRGPGMELLNSYSYDRGLNFMAFPFDKIPAGSEYDSDGLFLELRLTWQLYIYYHIMGVDTNFFPRLFAQLRSTPLSGDPQEQSMQFYQIVSRASNTDMTEFFEAWGWFNPIAKLINQYGSKDHILTSSMIQQAKTLVASKGYPKAKPIQYIEDRTAMDSEDKNWASTLGQVGHWSTFKENRKISGEISYSKSGELVTISGGDNAVGFEIRQGSSVGKVVNFSVRYSFSGAKLTGTNKLYAVQADGQRIEVPLK